MAAHAEILPGVLVLLALGLGPAGRQRVLQQLVHGAAALDDVRQGVVDVAEQRDDVGVHPRHALGRRQPLDRRRHRLEGDEEVEHLADEEVDALGRLGRGPR